ncbi:uncharacterized protein LOC123320218 [Coccinella septempunctata]|uniref:uncharacterized protein LOC123320218 n=1 Tax=Coccinella septempunctata TaxID=41139 RepID=UPI001D08BFA5|nr:uncharacterized protein LOC123320218 [Coccinella septempunctata]
MGSEIEIPETPNWLKELEAKRERRLKTKLGHELGAGAPCLTCDDKCPGLDLHFWRKICKNCKCSKENHEVQDDDIYGWAQDELLGTKVNRLKRKIVLPGRKDKEVELEWAPNGQKETIDKYLKTVPPELLPIKGSQAAQDRKQMLKKQIPVHDIDPTLCHDLTDEELKKMQEYVAHIKQSSVGVGHLIQINFNKGKTHVLDKNDAMFLINNVPKGIVSSENVILHGGDNSVPLKNLRNRLGGLDLKEKPDSDAYQSNTPQRGEFGDRSPLSPSFREKQETVNNVIQKNTKNNLKQIVLDPVGNRVVTEDIQVPQETCLRDLSYPYNDYPVSPPNVGLQSRDNRFGVKNLVPSAFVPIKHSVNSYEENEPVKDLREGSVRDLTYPSQFINNQLKSQKNLPHYNPGNIHTVEENQNPAYFKPIKDLSFSESQKDDFNSPGHTFYPPQGALTPGSPFRTIEGASMSPLNSPSRNPLLCQRNPQMEMPSGVSGFPQMSHPNTLDYNEERLGKLGKSDENLPHYSPGKTVLYENQQTPAKIKNLKDLAYSTYGSPPVDGAQQEDYHQLSVKDRLNKLKQKELSVLGPRNSPISDRTLSPSKISIKDRVMNLTPSFSNPMHPDNQGYGIHNSPSHSFGPQSPLCHKTNPRGSDTFTQPSGTPTKGSQDSLPSNNLKNVPYLGQNSPSHHSNNENLRAFVPGNQNIHEDDLQPSYIPIGAIRDIEYENPDIRTALSKDNELFEGSTPNKFEPNLDVVNLPCCHYCKETFGQEELAIAIPERSDAIYHTGCFKCHGCNQILADMFYFYDKSSNNIYCGRDYAKIRGIPRCMACDELIFVKEYCLAENSTFHVKHFCCFECDKPLADQNYVMENNQPVCIPCYELTKANKCYACKEVIHPDQQGLQLKDGVHFHATDDCFACKVCKKSLFGAKLLFRNDCLYCSHDCYNSDA